MSGDITAIDVHVTIAGTAIPKNDLFDLIVRQDPDHPDAASLVLANEAVRYSEKLEAGAEIEVKMGHTAGAAATTVFKGELVGIEPRFDTGAPQRVTLQAFNKLHVLARGRKSAAYLNVTDKDIVDAICQACSLTPDYGASPPSVQYSHVYQHNQSDLEFLRLRAARIGCELSVDDTKLYFRKRDFSDSGVKLLFGVEKGLRTFLPRLSTAHQVSEVRVRAFDPLQKKEVIGVAKPPSSSKLGDKQGSAVADQKHSGVMMVASDIPVHSKEEADAIAQAILQERMLSYISGRAAMRGNPDVKAGIVVSIVAHDQRFDGKYYVRAVTHRYFHSGQRSGFVTEMALLRDAAGSPQTAQQSKPAPAQPPAQPAPKSSPKPPPPPSAPQTTWVEVKLIGEDDKPIAGVRYRIKLPSGEIQEGELDGEGTIRYDAIDQGNVEVSFPDLDADAWAPV